MEHSLTAFLSALQTVISPTNSSLVQLCPDGEIKWKPLQFTQGDIGESNQDCKFAGPR